jgi:hypothetical protein
MTDLVWTKPTDDYNHERGFITWEEPKWVVIPCPLEATFLELFSPTYPKVKAGDPVERWQLRSGNGFVTTRPTAEECMEIAALTQLLIDGDDSAVIVALLEKLRDKPETRGTHFVDEVINTVKVMAWKGQRGKL